MRTMNGKTTANQAAPDLLTVEEAARVLRIGRTKVYELARLYLVTGGAEGLPVVRGRTGQTLTGPSVWISFVCSCRNTPRITPMAPPMVDPARNRALRSPLRLDLGAGGTDGTDESTPEAHHSRGRLPQPPPPANGVPLLRRSLAERRRRFERVHEFGQWRVTGPGTPTTVRGRVVRPAGVRVRRLWGNDGA